MDETSAGADDGIGLSRIGQIMMPVSDLARARDFYRDALGMTFLFEVPHMAFFELSGVRLMLGERESDGDAASGSILYYRVDDIQTARRSLGERGVSFDREPALVAEMEDHDLWLAFFRDSEGNRLALMSEVANA